jgi:hypothetical protein
VVTVDRDVLREAEQKLAEDSAWCGVGVDKAANRLSPPIRGGAVWGKADA